MEHPPFESRVPLPVYLLTVEWRIESVGGVNQVVLNLAEQLQHCSPYRPVIAELSWEGNRKPSSTRGIPVLNLRMRELSGIRPVLGWLATLPANMWALSRFLRQQRVAVVNIHFPSLDTIVFFLLRWSGLYRGKLLLSFHGSDVTAVANVHGIYRMLWRRVIASADGVVTCSEALRRQVFAAAPGAARVVVIHNGVDASRFAGTRPPRDRRRTVLHIGKFEHKKSQDILLNAFQLLSQTLPDATLILVGARGPALDSVREQISISGLQDRVEIYVDVPHEHVPHFFGRADLFVLPSRAEPFGLVLLEAGAAGLPVVATRVGGIPELLEDGVTGTLVPAEDVGALETAIHRMLTDAETAARMAQAWHEKVLTCWSWQKTCRQYLALIERPDVNT